MSLDCQIIVCLDPDDIVPSNTDETHENSSEVTTERYNGLKQPVANYSKKICSKSALHHIVCQGCGLNFSTSESYNVHLLTCGKGEVTIISCPYCPKSFGGEDELDVHLMSDHSVETDEPNSVDYGKKNEANSLGKQCSNQMHNKPLSGNDKSFKHQCSNCLITFPNEEILSKHTIKCSVYHCKFCKLTFTKQQYDKHLREKLCFTKRKSYKCSQLKCDKTFIRHEHLWTHLKQEHGIDRNVERHFFRNLNDFHKWKKEDDVRNTFVMRLKPTDNISQNNSCSYHYYHCDFKLKMKKHVNNQISDCPARFLVKEFDGGVSVTYYTFHNHELNVTSSEASIPENNCNNLKGTENLANSNTDTSNNVGNNISSSNSQRVCQADAPGGSQYPIRTSKHVIKNSSFLHNRINVLKDALKATPNNSSLLKTSIKIKETSEKVNTKKINLKDISKTRKQLEIKLIKLLRMIALDELEPLLPEFQIIVDNLYKKAEDCYLSNHEGEEKEIYDESRSPTPCSHIDGTRAESKQEEALKKNNETVADITKINKNNQHPKDSLFFHSSLSRSSKLRNISDKLWNSIEKESCEMVAADFNNKLSENKTNMKDNEEDSRLEPCFDKARDLKRSSDNIKSSYLPSFIDMKVPKLSSDSLTFKKISEQNTDNSQTSSFTNLLNAKQHKNLIINVGSQQLSVVHLKSLDICISDSEASELKKICNVFRKGWLFDCVITAFLEILASRSKNVVVIDPAATNLVALGNDFTQVFPKLKFGVESTLLLPLNLNNGHWALMIAKIPKKELMFLDPKQGEDIYGYGHFIKPWMQILNKVLGNQHDWSLNQPQRLLQVDSHSCGVYVCWYGQQYLEDKSFIASFNPDNYRQNIFATIFENASKIEISQTDG